MSRTADPGGRRVFRSPAALAVWWLWVLFAAGNLIDLIVAGHDHASVVAGFSLLAITGVVYAIAWRPRLNADAAGLTIVNPVRVHQVGWPAVAGFDTTDLLRVRCAWPAGGPAEPESAPGTGAEDAPEFRGESALAKRAIYAWAVRYSRRGQIAAQAKAKRQAARGRGGSRVGLGLGFGAPPPDNAPPPAPLGLDAVKVIAALTERADKARADAPDARAVPPRSDWHWPSVAVVVVPLLALLIAVLA